MWMLPASISRMARTAPATSPVKIPAASPYAVPLACATADAQSAAVLTEHGGVVRAGAAAGAQVEEVVCCRSRNFVSADNLM